MKLFDCNATFGLGITPPPQYAATPDDLLQEMDFCHVDEALVTCAAQRDDSPIVGNELVVQLTRGRPRLRPTWAILPPQLEELAPSVDAFYSAMAASGVKALWAFPLKHKYLLNRTTFGGFFEEMIARRVPLFLPLTETSGGIGGWQLVDTLLSYFPALTLIPTDQSVWGQDRYFRPLVERFPNLYVEIARYELGRGIEAFCRKYGPDRMLFGTRYPETPMGGPVLNLLHADIPTEYKEAIASGNLERLLGEVKL
jgi:hypothetical protein